MRHGVFAEVNWTYSDFESRFSSHCSNQDKN